MLKTVGVTPALFLRELIPHREIAKTTPGNHLKINVLLKIEDQSELPSIVVMPPKTNAKPMEAKKPLITGKGKNRTKRPHFNQPKRNNTPPVKIAESKTTHVARTVLFSMDIDMGKAAMSDESIAA